MRRVPKVILLVALVVALAALFFGPWGAERRGAPLSALFDDSDSCMAAGRVARLASHSYSVGRPASAPHVTTRDEIAFTKSGICTMISNFSEDRVSKSSCFRSSSDYVFNSRGEALGARIHGEPDPQQHSEWYTYDSRKRQVIATIYGPKPDSGPYVRQAWMIRLRQFFLRRKGDVLVGRTVTTLDSGGSPIRIEEYDSNGPVATTTLRRNSKGQVTHSKWQSYTVPRDSTEYSCVLDARGNPIEERVFFNGSSKAGEWTKSTYQYDSHGNWIQRTLAVYDKGIWRPCDVTERKITYYK